MGKKRLQNMFAAIFLTAAMVLTAIQPVTAVQAEDEASTGYDIDNIASSKGRQNYSNWAVPVISYLEPLDDGGLMSVQYGSAGTNRALLVGYYRYDAFNDSYQYEDTKSKTIGLELPNFGAFYASDQYYFVLTGWNNPDESNEQEVYRITKYDKDWKEVGRASLKGANTTRPFAFGTARMEASGEYLLIRTCHEMYKTYDGRNHQANVTIQLNMETMEITDTMTRISGSGYASP